MINATTLDTVALKITPYLLQIGKELGLDLSVGNGSFTSVDGKLQLIIKSLNESGEAVDRSMLDFKHYAKSYGLSPEDYGKTFKHGNETYKITGLKTNRPKFPINAIRVKDGKGFKFPAASVINGLILVNKKFNLTQLSEEALDILAKDELERGIV